MEMATNVRAGAVMAAFALLVGAGTVQATSASASTADAGHSFYVNNLPRSGCSDNGPGTFARPWCDFTPVNDGVFGPGTHILLASGATWDQELILPASGAPGQDDVLSSYGTGPRPEITRDGIASDVDISMTNPSYWRVSNLNITGAGVGIYIYYSTLFHHDLSFNNLYLHDINGVNPQTSTGITCTTIPGVFMSAGIYMTGDVSFGPAQYALKGVTVNQIQGTHNQDSISFDWCNGAGATDGSAGSNLVQDVVLSHLYLHDDGGPAPAGSFGCADSLRLVNLSHVIVRDSVLNDEAACYAPNGTAAIFTGRDSDFDFVNDIITNVPNEGTYDQTGIDFEAFDSGTNGIHDDYIAHNAGPGAELLGDGLDTTSVLNVSGNLFVDNAGADNPNYRCSLSDWGTSTEFSGSIEDNLYYEPTCFLGVVGAGDISGFTVSGNVAAASAAATTYAAEEYGTHQGANDWSYDYSTNGSGWSQLHYSPGSGQWTAKSGQAGTISRFDESAAGGWVARTWTAPQAGVIDIRGLALGLGSGGNGMVEITQDGRTLFAATPVGRDTSVETNLSAVSVAAGDQLRFEIQSSGSDTATVSWTPAIAYQQ